MFRNMSIFEAIKIGGPVMFVLIICSVVSIAIVVERLMNFYQRSRISRIGFIQSIRERLKLGNVGEALRLCKEASTPFASVVAAGLNAFNEDEKEITEAMEREIVVEISKLERRTAIVGTIGSTAVYIGLLGTVFGIIKTFQDITLAGSSGINVVIHGISEALVCTAAGLFVAIPAVAAYNYFTKRVSGFVMDMELCASELTGLIKAYKRTDEKELQRTGSSR